MSIPSIGDQAKSVGNTIQTPTVFNNDMEVERGRGREGEREELGGGRERERGEGRRKGRLGQSVAASMRLQSWSHTVWILIWTNQQNSFSLSEKMSRDWE